MPGSGSAGTALLLTGLAGLVDAVVYLRLGRVFVANQSGNCVLLAIGVAQYLLGGIAPSGVHGPVISLAAFCVAAALTGWLGYGRPLWFLLGAEAVLLVTAVALPGPVDAQVGLAAAAMGVQSVQGIRMGVPGVTTTVVTGTLATFFTRRFQERGKRRDMRLLALAWLLYIVGAFLGAAGTHLR